MAGFLYLIMAASSIFFLNSDCLICNSSEFIFLGQSIYYWAALYYSIIGLFSLLARNRFIAYLMTCVMFIHTCIIIYSYICNEHSCLTCLAFIVLEITAVIAYVTDNKEKTSFVYPLLSVLFAVAMGVLLIPGMHYSDKYSNSIIASPKLNTLTQNGTETLIDLRTKPALVFSWWCSHCDEALKKVSRLKPKDRPYLILVNAKVDDVLNIRTKLRQFGLDEHPYFIITENTLIKGIPATIWWANNELHYELGWNGGVCIK